MAERRTLMPPDAVWYNGDTDRNSVTVSGVVWLDRTIDPDRIRALVRERLVERHPVFAQRVVRARNPLLMPHWEDDPDFDVDRHIEVVHLPAPGDTAALQALCSEQRSTPLDRDRPPWKWSVIQGYRGDRTALHVRMQHCIGDGWALMRLLLTLTDEQRTVPRDLGPPPAGTGRRGDGMVNALAGTVRPVVDVAADAVAHPDRVVPAARAVVRHIAWGAQNLLFPPRPARTVLMGRPCGEKCMVWDERGIPLERVKEAGRPFGATVNDVLLAALTGALRTHLAEHDSPADEALVLVPVSLRAPDEPLRAHLGNRLGLLPVLLPTGLASPLGRLHEVKHRMDAVKGSPGPLVSWALLAATAVATPPLEVAIHRYNQARSSGVVTNVPGPRAPLYLAGARIDGVVGWGGVTGDLNLNWAFISYAGSVYSGVVTDIAVTPDPQRILGHLRAEVDALVGLARRGPRAAPRTRRRRVGAKASG